MEPTINRPKAMNYQPTEDDPVLVFKNGGFGFNYLNGKARNAFWANVEKCQGIKVESKDLSSSKKKNS